MSVVVIIVADNTSPVKKNFPSISQNGDDKMGNICQYAYSFDRNLKSESFGIITDEKNYGGNKKSICAAAREMLSKSTETFSLLEIKKSVPFGEFLSDTISIDFDRIMEHMKKEGWDIEQPIFPVDLAQFPEEAQFLIPQKGKVSKRKVLEDINKLYQIRVFVEMCIEYPQMFSFGQFYRFLVVPMTDCFPRSLGFFTAVKEQTQEKYFMTYGWRRAAMPVKGLDPFNLEGIREAVRPVLPYEKDNGYNTEANMEVFTVSGIVDVALISLFYLIQEKMTIKRCENCGKFFVPLLRSDAIYCDRLAPQDSEKSCKEYGSKVRWYESVVGDEVLKISRNIYYAKKMLAQRNPDKPEYMEMYEYYKVERKKWEAEVRAGTKTREAFLTWLNQMKNQRTLQ